MNLDRAVTATLATRRAAVPRASGRTSASASRSPGYVPLIARSRSPSVAYSRLARGAPGFIPLEPSS